MQDHDGTGRGLIAGRYRLDRSIGRGGVGVLWAGYDTLLERPVAVKQVIPPEHLAPTERDQLTRRALREARAAARTVHPSAITVYDVVEQDGCPWIVMQLLAPWSLADIVNDTGPLAPPAAARIGLDLLEAIVAAEGAGVLHRDVKPGNVLFRDGRAVLVDFGIAALDDATTLTHDGLVVGSPAFLPPERARGEQPTLAGDLWSLGATLYAAVEGRSPFQRGNALATLAAVLTEDPPPALHAGPLAPVIDLLLAADPAERPTPDQTRDLLLEVLRAFATQPNESTEPAEPRAGPSGALTNLTTSADRTLSVRVRGGSGPARRGNGAFGLLAVLAALAVLAVAVSGLAVLVIRGTADHIGAAAPPSTSAPQSNHPTPPPHGATTTPVTSGPPSSATGESGSPTSETSMPPNHLSTRIAPATVRSAASARAGGGEGRHRADRQGDQGSQGDQGNQGNQGDQGNQDGD